VWHAFTTSDSRTGHHQSLLSQQGEGNFKRRLLTSTPSGWLFGPRRSMRRSKGEYVRFGWVPLPSHRIRSSVQCKVVSEQGEINNRISFLKAYPIISLRLGYKFPRRRDQRHGIATCPGSSRADRRSVAVILCRRLRLLRWRNRPSFRPEEMIDKISHETGSDQDHAESERTHPQN
jgi:hypothetical protein